MGSLRNHPPVAGAPLFKSGLVAQAKGEGLLSGGAASTIWRSRRLSASSTTAISGGFQVSSGAGYATASYPSASDVWTVELSAFAGSIEANAYALCATVELPEI